MRTLPAVASLFFAGCAAAFGQTDDFPAVLAHGCATREACATLVSQAQRRTSECAPNTIGMIRCRDARADLAQANALFAAASEREEANEAAGARESRRSEHEAAPRAARAQDVLADEPPERAQESIAAAPIASAKAPSDDDDCARDRATRLAARAERPPAQAWIEERCSWSQAPLEMHDENEGLERALGGNPNPIVIDMTQVECPDDTPVAIAKEAKLQNRGKGYGFWRRDLTSPIDRKRILRDQKCRGADAAAAAAATPQTQSDTRSPDTSEAGSNE